jgi:hypothetical protein
MMKRSSQHGHERRKFGLGDVTSVAAAGARRTKKRRAQENEARRLLMSQA